jgi:hypothetical protein
MLRTFTVSVTIELDIDVMLTDDVDHDRAVAQLFADDYARGIRYKAWKAREYDDPVRVADVKVGGYPTHVKDKGGTDEVQGNSKGPKRGGPLRRLRMQAVHGADGGDDREDGPQR